ncbi:hypothetical protein ACFQL1_22335 [Halomicroarcula sp. GCM10025709]|uniref:hypothetical protein n=1 Tax=Haloarcula TaxID=2237 RepID=UPI0024C2B78C|nr:hypothetical protein [Halomicroarcula sp. YJ-61-S]
MVRIPGREDVSSADDTGADSQSSDSKDIETGRLADGLGRRGFLKGTVAATLAGLYGTGSVAAATDSPVDESVMSETQVDVSQGEEVSGIVENVSNGEILVFPSGRFRWSDEAQVFAEDWGIRCQSDTVFEVPAGYGDGDKGLVLRTKSGSLSADNYFLENLTFDSSGRAAPGMRLSTRKAAHIRGLNYAMNGPKTFQEHGNGIAAMTLNSDGIFRIDDYRQFNNGDIGGYAGGDSRVGIFVGGQNDGTIHLKNPVLQGFPNNACYVSRQPGTVVVEGGLLMNNNVSAVRVGGGVEVRDTTVVIDVDDYTDGDGVLDASVHNTRGLWGDSRSSGSNGGVARNVSFIIRSYQRSSGLAAMLENDSMTVEDSQFLLETDITGVQPGDYEIAVRNSDFAGSASGAIAGSGSIPGDNNRVASNIDPGSVSTSGTNATFDWSQTHPETPNRQSNSTDDTSDSTDDTSDSTDDTSDSTDDNTDDSTEEPSDDTDATVRTLEIRSANGTGWWNYTLTTSGQLENTYSGDEEEITQDGDGSYTAQGVVGNGGSDYFDFTGEITAFSAEVESSDYTILVDGEDVTDTLTTDSSAGDDTDDSDTTDSTTERTLEVRSANGTGWWSYSLTTDGTLENTYSGDEEPITQNGDGSYTAQGVVGNGGSDYFDFTGEITAFSAEVDAGDYTILVDGEDVTDSVGTDSSSSDTDTSDDSDTTQYENRTIEVRSANDTGWWSYALTTDGTLENKYSGDKEEITQNGDGSYTAQGVVGNGGSDYFDFDGEIVGFSAEVDASDYAIFVDGENVTTSVTN